jgi:hypothetical protein
MMVANVIKMLIEILIRIVALWPTFGLEGPHKLDWHVKLFLQKPVLVRMHFDICRKWWVMSLDLESYS